MQRIWTGDPCAQSLSKLPSRTRADVCFLSKPQAIRFPSCRSGDCSLVERQVDLFVHTLWKMQFVDHSRSYEPSIVFKNRRYPAAVFSKQSDCRHMLHQWIQLNGSGRMYVASNLNNGGCGSNEVKVWLLPAWLFLRASIFHCGYLATRF